jgi:hypothetical protein
MSSVHSPAPDRRMRPVIGIDISCRSKFGPLVVHREHMTTKRPRTSKSGTAALER